MNLLFPEWQGCGVSNLVFHGAKRIRRLLPDDLRWVEIDVPEHEQLDRRFDVLGYDAVVRQLRRVRAEISLADPSTILLIAGTCGAEIAPLSYLNRAHRGDLCILWFDAHGDLNAPDSSPSKHFHGMPLRILLGEGPAEILNLAFSRVAPEQIVLAGVRDLDAPERDYVEAHRIGIVGPEDLSDPGVLLSAVEAKGFSNAYIHIDLDVLEPDEFPHLLVPVAGGISFVSLLANLRELTLRTNVVGSSIVEYAPRGEGSPRRIEDLADALLDRGLEEK